MSASRSATISSSNTGASMRTAGFGVNTSGGPSRSTGRTITRPNAAKAVVAVRPAFEEIASNIARIPFAKAPILGASFIGRASVVDPWRRARFSCARATFSARRLASGTGVATENAALRSSKSSLIARSPLGLLDASSLRSCANLPCLLTRPRLRPPPGGSCHPSPKQPCRADH